MSVVQICNRGLSKYIGGGRITSITESGTRAEQCNLHYDDERRGLLEKHWWTFAKTRVVLAELVNDRPNEWLYKYKKPANILEIHWVNHPEVARTEIAMHRNPDTERHIEGEAIYCNVQFATMQYTQDIENTDLMPQYFKDALSARLASAICVSITESVDRARFAGEQAIELTDNAIAEDEQNTPPIDRPDAEYLQARGVGGYGYGHDDYNNNGWR